MESEIENLLMMNSELTKSLNLLARNSTTTTLLISKSEQKFILKPKNKSTQTQTPKYVPKIGKFNSIYFFSKRY